MERRTSQKGSNESRQESWILEKYCYQSTEKLDETPEVVQFTWCEMESKKNEKSDSLRSLMSCYSKLGQQRKNEFVSNNSFGTFFSSRGARW